MLGDQEERERAERAEDQLDQLTRSLAQEKSTSSALQAERAALERLQVLCLLGGQQAPSPACPQLPQQQNPAKRVPVLVHAATIALPQASDT